MSQRSALGARTVVGLTFVLAGAACSRTPPEPAPPSTTNSPAIADKTGDRTVQTTASTPVPPGPPQASAPAASASSPRCIAATPAAAPPIPPPASAAACPPDPEGIPKSPIAQVGFPEAPGNPKVEVEIARTDHDIQRGLMYRRTMGEEHGMLFNLDDHSDHKFWMHNTCMALDMLFVDDDGVVVGIVEGATPLTDTTRSVGCASSWVLEVNAGWCRRHGVRAGQKMGIPSAAR